VTGPLGQFTDVITIGKGVTELSSSSREGHVRAGNELNVVVRASHVRQWGRWGLGSVGFCGRGRGYIRGGAVNEEFASEASTSATPGSVLQLVPIGGCGAKGNGDTQRPLAPAREALMSNYT